MYGHSKVEGSTEEPQGLFFTGLTPNESPTLSLEGGRDGKELVVQENFRPEIQVVVLSVQSSGKALRWPLWWGCRLCSHIPLTPLYCSPKPLAI